MINIRGVSRKKILYYNKEEDSHTREEPAQARDHMIQLMSQGFNRPQEGGQLLHCRANEGMECVDKDRLKTMGYTDQSNAQVFVLIDHESGKLV